MFAICYSAGLYTEAFTFQIAGDSKYNKLQSLFSLYDILQVANADNLISIRIFSSKFRRSFINLIINRNDIFIIFVRAFK